MFRLDAAKATLRPAGRFNANAGVLSFAPTAVGPDADLELLCVQLTGVQVM